MLAAVSTRVHHFAVSAADLETTVNWYREKLGFNEEYRYGIPEMGLQAAFLTLGDFRLEIFEMAGSREPGDDQRAFDRYLSVRGLKHVALAVDDLPAAREVLERRGVPFVSEIMDVPDSGGEKFCFFADPDGVLIELFQPVARHEHRHVSR